MLFMITPMKRFSLIMGPGGDESQQAQDADQAEDGSEGSAEGQQTERHDGKIKDVPPLAEIGERTASVRGNLERDLEHKNGKHGGVERLQEIPVPRDQGGIRLQSRQHARSQDHGDDRGVKRPGSGDFPGQHGHEAGSGSRTIRILSTEVRSMSMISKRWPARTKLSPSRG